MRIVCLKWGDKFSHEHVNRIYRMCKKNMQKDFTFTCYTENPTGINKDINIVLLGDYDLENWWWKLCLFKNPAAEINIFLDLDVIIQNDITHFADYVELNKLRIVKAYWKPYELFGTDMNYNSSVLVWKGDLSNIWKEFIIDPDYYMVKYAGIDSYLYYHHYELLNVFPRGQIYSRLYGIDENNYYKAGEPLMPLFKDDQYPICIFNGWRRKTEFISGKYILDNEGYNGFEKYWN